MQDLDTTWLDKTRERLDDVRPAVAAQAARLSDPAVQRNLGWGLCAVALLWLVFAFAELFWHLVPQPAIQPQPASIINPLMAPPERHAERQVDIEQLVSWSLFGQIDSPGLSDDALNDLPAAPGQDLDAIDANAEETRLPLVLSGIVYSSDPARARAMIEFKQAQAQYGVGDELPVGNTVTVARILADRVVIDNRGTYELLLLFGEDERIVSRAAPAASAEQGDAGRRRTLAARNRKILQTAEAHRRRQFGAPTSLAQVVNIAAVREGGSLDGYRVSAGRDSAQFEALGFRADDVIVGVNGIAMSDPAHARELFNVLQSADGATFEVQRGDETITLTVGLGEGLDK